MPDRFVLHLTRIPRYEARIQALVLEIDFKSMHSDALENVESYAKAIDAINGNEGLLLLLALVREVGNYVNDGGFAGGAAGFSLSSVLKLADVKGKDNVNLIHFVAQQLVAHHSEALTQLKVCSDRRGTKDEGRGTRKVRDQQV